MLANSNKVNSVSWQLPKCEPAFSLCSLLCAINALILEAQTICRKKGPLEYPLINFRGYRRVNPVLLLNPTPNPPFPSRPLALDGSLLPSWYRSQWQVRLFLSIFQWILQNKKNMYSMMSILPLGCRSCLFISFTYILSFPPIHIVAAAGLPFHKKTRKKNKFEIYFTFNFHELEPNEKMNNKIELLRTRAVLMERGGNAIKFNDSKPILNTQATCQIRFKLHL